MNFIQKLFGKKPQKKEILGDLFEKKENTNCWHHTYTVNKQKVECLLDEDRVSFEAVKNIFVKKKGEVFEKMHGDFRKILVEKFSKTINNERAQQGKKIFEKNVLENFFFAHTIVFYSDGFIEIDYQIIDNDYTFYCSLEISKNGEVGFDLES